MDLQDSSSLGSPSLPTDGEDVPTANPRASNFSTEATVSREASRMLTSNDASATRGAVRVPDQGIVLLVDDSEEATKR